MDSLLSTEQKDKVTSILNQVSELSESEKHVLYLKLPDEADESSSSKEQSNLTLHWIRTHYVQDRDICVPKQDVYKQYRQHCETSGGIPLNSFNFGKMMRLVFPNIHDRRLGQRGKSKYCYGGLRKKEDTESSSSAEVLSSEQVKEDLDLYVLSCQLVCEWARQLLGRPFVDIRMLSEYLVSKGLSCGKTAAKFSLLSGSTSPPKLVDKKSPNSKHHERQMLLQRKLRHNKLIREHKDKLKQQPSNLWEQNSEKTDRSSFNPASYPLGQDERTTSLNHPGISYRRVQLRPSSVQPYVWSVGSSHTSEKQDSSLSHSMGYERSNILGFNASNIGETVASIICTGQRPEANAAHATTTESTVGQRQSVHTSVPPKRCHSTSVVEKQSSSLYFALMELTGHTLGKCPSQVEPNSGAEMANDKALSSSFSSSQGTSSTPVDIHIISSSSEGVSNGMSPLASVLSPLNVQRNVPHIPASSVSRVSMDGLLMPQHPKRYGDSISPDRSSLTKRKCTTSLGVTKQQSLEASNSSSENPDCNLPRLRPYSCPVSVNMSQFDAALKEGIYLSNRRFIDDMCKNETGDSKENLTGKVSSLRTATGSPAFLSDRRKFDERRKVRPEQQKKVPTVCHFVQKPTVINRPKHNMTTITSCPDLKQVVTSGDISQQHQESISDKQSYNILNSLLSLNYDILSDAKVSAKTLPISLSSSSLTSYVGTLATTETSKPILQGAPLRLMTNTPHVVENPSILSSLSSRSAFVPVTSHKLQAATSTLKETDIVMSGLSSQNQSAACIGKKDQDTPMSSSSSKPQSVECLYSGSTHTLVKPCISHAHVRDSSTIATEDEYNLIRECADYNATITSTSSSSSSSSSSTLCRSGESTSSGCESVLTTPTPAPPTEKSDCPPQVPTSTVSVKSTVIPTTCSVPAWITVAQCKSSPSVGCTTPVMSPLICPSSHSYQTSTSSSITTPKRGSRNRFTPIRPKLGGGTNTPSPQKLGGMTTPSPQKKDTRPDIKPDMRLVSAILKEQRVKSAQDLLVNLANSYQGEVKLQMPAELLGLSPAGKSKSTDVHVTIRSPSNISQPKNLQPDINKQSWPLSSPTPPHKEITVIVEPVCQPASCSTTSPALPSCLISTSSAQLLPGLPSPLGVQVVTHSLYNSTHLPQTLISPKATLQGQYQHTPLTISSSEPANQVIILPPVSSCLPSTQTVGGTWSKPIIVEDDKGNMYSLDQKSGFTVLPQNLQHCLKGSQPVDPIRPPSQNTSLFNSTSGLLSVSELKGHVIGPDASGQTYLLVPNTEPVIATTTASGFLCQQMSPVLATTLTKHQVPMQSNVPCHSTVEPIRPYSSPSSSFLSELNQQLATSISGQTLIQHSSGSSAFHKCSSSTHRRSSNISESIKAELVGGEYKDLPPSQSSVSTDTFPNCLNSAEFPRSDKSCHKTVTSDRQICDEVSGIPKCPGVRKRKASTSQEYDHEDRKRLNSSTGQKDESPEDDDDVFIVKIEDTPVSKSVKKNSEQIESSSNSSLSATSLSSPSVPQCNPLATSPNPAVVEETKVDSKRLLTDTDTLLGMIEDSKSMTVKETIIALNELRAKQSENASKSFSTTNIEQAVHKERQRLSESSSCQDLSFTPQNDAHTFKFKRCDDKMDAKSVIVNRPQSARCTSVSPYTLGDGACLYSLDHQGGTQKNISKIERTGRRHISLNLESLESDALLDTEPALDHRLVGDIKGATSIKSDQRTSVGIAAKSARSVGLVLSDRNLDYKGKSKQQHKRDTNTVYVSLPIDKKDECNDAGCASQREIGLTKHPNISTEQDCVKQGSKSQQNTLVKCGDRKPEFVCEQPRSMSCVRDILQHGSRHGFLKCVSAMGDKSASEFGCHNVKALSMSNLNQSSVIGSKASEHPLLAHCLSVPCRKVLDNSHVEAETSHTDFTLQHGNEVSSKEQNSAEVGLSICSLPENELPGDIADFITESMSCGNSYSRDAFRRNSLTSLLADLVRNGQNERDHKSDGQNIPMWRSVSVPNTIPEGYYDFTSDKRQRKHETSLINSPAPSIKNNVIADNGSESRSVDVQTKQMCSRELSSLALRLSWESLTEPHVAGHLSSNPESLKDKDVFLEHASQTLDSSASLSSGTFLSPIGPAKLTRRSSVERSSSGDRGTTKTTVESLTSKGNTERPVPRMRTHSDRVKMAGDRSLTQTPVDRSLSLTPVDRVVRKISRDKSPNKMDSTCRDHTTAAVQQESAKERDAHKQSGNRVVTRSPAEKTLSNLVCEGSYNHRSLDAIMHQGPVDCAKAGDRSHNQTPISDAGYSSVSQTPISEVGYSSVSQSPVMMSIPGMFGECGRQEQTSPATIFMPLRSDSVMSLVNSSRSNDGVDCFLGPSAQGGSSFRSVSDIAQCLHRTSEDDCNKTNTKSFLFDKDSVSQRTSLFQDIIDDALLDHTIYKNDMEADIKRTPERHSIRDTLSFLDFEKFMSVQLNCIPTPPCSPSASPQLLADTSQSPLSFSVPFSHAPPHSRQSWVTPTSSVPSHHFPSVTAISSHVTTCLSSNSIYVMSSSPGVLSSAGQYSPGLLPNTSPSSYAIAHACSSPHQYYPHPSPPFTPSLQRCLASPRCPTPCSHRSLLSPCCATPCGDSNSAPNRFMPIQTSGILSTSLTATQTYIQPIRPVVTLASMANQSTHINLDFSQPEHNLSRPNKNSPSHTETYSPDLSFPGGHTLTSAGLKSDQTNLDLPSCLDRLKPDKKGKEGDTFHRQRKAKAQQKLRDDHKSDRTSHPALVLSLTGSIGSVSGQGMQAGWSQDINPASPSSVMKKGHNVSSHPQHAKFWKSRCDRPAPGRSSGHLRVDSPTYTENIPLSILEGQSSDSDRTIAENLNLPAPSGQTRSGEVDLNQHNLHQSDIVGEFSEGNLKHLPLDKCVDSTSQVKETGKLSNKPLIPSNVNYPYSYHLDFPFSLQLAKLSDQSRPSTKDQQSRADDFTSLISPQAQDKHDAGTSRASVLSTMLQALAFASSQSHPSRDNSFISDTVKSELFHRASDLPTAYYSGTAPNIDLTKVPFTLANLPTTQPSLSAQHNPNESNVDAYLAGLNSQLIRRSDCPSGNQDDLDETLNVLKSLDSQYFQQDDDSNSPETTSSL